MDAVCADGCLKPLEQPVFRCYCGHPAWSVTSGTARNPGRKFYICHKAGIGRVCPASPLVHPLLISRYLVDVSRGRRMKAPTTENHSDEGSYSSKKHEISEAVTALCLGFKSSVSKAIDQVVESPNNTLH